MSQPSPQRCTQHPSAAGWRCASCGNNLCPQCAMRRKAGTGWVTVCRSCGGFAKTLMVPRVATSYLRLLPDAFAYPFSVRGILVMLASGIVFGLLDMGGFYAWLLATGAFYSLLFLVIRTSALGHTDVPEADAIEHPVDLMLAGLTALFVMLLGIAPLIVYEMVRENAGPLDLAFEVLRGQGAWLKDPIAWLTLLLGAIWVPMALLLAATQTPFGTVINPVSSAQCIARIWKDYLPATLIFWVLYAASKIVSTLAGTFSSLVPIPIVSWAVAQAMTMYLPLVYARALGLLLFARGGDIGYGSASDYMVPALGDTLPMEELVSAGGEGAGAHEPLERIAPQVDSSAPDAISLPPMPIAGLRPPVEPIALPPDEPTPAPAAPMPSGPLASAPPPERLLYSRAEAPAYQGGPEPLGADPNEYCPPIAVPPAAALRNPRAPAKTAAPAVAHPSAPPPAPPKPAVAAPGAQAAAAAAPAVSGAADPAGDAADDTIRMSNFDVLSKILEKESSAGAAGASPGGTTSAAPPAASASAPPPAVLAAKGTQGAEESVAALAAAGRWSEVAAVYRARKGAVPGLDASQLAHTAEAALRESDYMTAAHALRRAGLDHPHDAGAPDALLKSARIFDQQLRQAPEATRLLRVLAERHPGTPAGAFAARMLSSRRTG